jgi:hypothetical protein
MVDFYFGLRVIEKLFPFVFLGLIVIIYIVLVRYNKYLEKRYAKRKKELVTLGFKIKEQNYEEIMVAPDTRWNLTEYEVSYMKNRKFKRFLRNYKEYLEKHIQED